MNKLWLIFLIANFSVTTVALAKPAMCDMKDGLTITPIDEAGQTQTQKQKRVGYMWVGNFDEGTWSKKILSVADEAEPSSLEVGHHYTLLTGGLHIKDSLPVDGDHSTVPNINKLHIGDKIKLLEAPIAFERLGKTRYWAKVSY